MLLDMFSIYDAVNELFDPAISAQSSNDFLRNLSLSLENKETRNFKYRDDLSIFRVGAFDTQTGLITSLQAPVRVATMKELVKSEDIFDKRKFIEELKAVLGIK